MTDTMFTAGEVNFFLGIAVSKSEHADPTLKNLGDSVLAQLDLAEKFAQKYGFQIKTFKDEEANIEAIEDYLSDFSKAVRK